MSGPERVATRSRVLLALAAVAVAFAAADTYVVVLALPDMVASVGISAEELQRAAPIISGFLLGYVAILPLIGRIADLRGRTPVLVGSLVVFALGSLVTALAYDMPSMVVGRFLQGLGGGGLVPATLALVADLYPAHRRGVPLGIVSAVQEAGSVLGPLLGAVVLAVADWRAIFVLNLVVGVVLALAVRALARRDPAVRAGPPGRRRPDLVGLLLLLLASALALLVVLRPSALLRDLTWGQVFVGLVPGGRWLTPVGLAAMVVLALLVAWCLVARQPLLDLRGWWRTARAADLVGATYLAVALGGVILAFATADPAIELFAEQGWWYLLGSALATVALVVHLRRASDPLVPRGALRARAAWGAAVVSLFVGAALIAAVVDIPLFARTTTYQDSQLMAALVLVRFLVALPVGAVVGGYLVRRLPAGVITAAGMLLAAAAFAVMSTWGVDSLESLSSDVVLVACGFGFGLALAPVNAAVLASTDAAVHGLASAVVVVARMVGMLVGISALTAIGLRRYYAALEDDPMPAAVDVCDGRTRCQAYTDLLAAASIPQEQAVFAGAAVCAVVAAVLALWLFHGARTREVDPRDVVLTSG
ncbi:putative triacylglyceride transporter [Nocardioides aquaticus]|uniref:Triacylglyceride transporter n=1 Tax=Nocardioides aquaticus TaxID=160826 RepID=A0ABX8EJQ7_9ACTN|nr:MFS transporter [Nocardioides aquaticus]QVT80706.1 putative triacylglyceride transporter [Nocardioides aquaticus]